MVELVIVGAAEPVLLSPIEDEDAEPVDVSHVTVQLLIAGEAFELQMIPAHVGLMPFTGDAPCIVQPSNLVAAVMPVSLIVTARFVPMTDA
jgi:hypothetical protein